MKNIIELAIKQKIDRKTIMDFCSYMYNWEEPAEFKRRELTLFLGRLKDAGVTEDKIKDAYMADERMLIFMMT